MKHLLLSTLLFLCIKCDAQKMDYIKNIKYLLALYGKDSTHYQDDKIEAFKNGGKQYDNKQFFNVKMPLLPSGTTALTLKYFNASVTTIAGQEDSNATILAGLAQENPKTVQLDFYSDWHENLDFNRINNGIYVPVAKVVEDDFIKFFSKNGWQFKDSVHNRFAESLIFKYKNLELTILFEVLQDVNSSPFRFEPDVTWPKDHIPNLKRFIHYIIQKKLK